MSRRIRGRLFHHVRELATMNRDTIISRSVPLILLAGALLLLVLVLSSLHFANLTSRNAQEALDAARLNGRVMRLFTLIQDAETSQRGYLLTGQEEFLKTFRRSENLIPLHFRSLLPDFQSIAVSSVTVERLDALIKTKLDELIETVKLKRSGQAEAALAVVITERGKQAMEEIRQIMVRIDAITNNVGFVRLSALTDATRLLLISITGGAILLVVLVGGAVALILWHSRQLKKASAALELQNETLEQKVRERTRYLERANRELQSYAYIVGHDLRAPLVNIMGFTAELERASGRFASYLLANPLPDHPAAKAAREAVQEDVPEALRFIRSSMKRMDDLINEILKLARAGNRTLQAEPLNLAALIDDVVATLKHRLDGNNTVVTISPDLPGVVSDRLALQQIFANLLDNAIKYADPSRRAVIEVFGKVVGEDVTVTVRDNGRGIASQDNERIFELFRRSGRQDKPGEGIGLAHVRALVRRLGGEVGVRSTLGQGTSFDVTLAADLNRAKNWGEQW
ncbi:CHASE3 domain-containing protein [Rhizobium sp. 32-5/1]|uniref:sensor histidine kinase n=1 Tax=Rhizobium sp. 32-5/1 TaxID=3019602 RepID=UPI00240E26A2|nr:sensor histidine kinase [Rhizobium sp. 32-5/1]WEZ84330.1 CHASE3 domain-containing protein [Rhizobium sp. 32-5/1]